MTSTAEPVGGEVTSGVNMNRDNTTFPDEEQARREQARQESEWAQGLRDTHPSNVATYPNDFVKAQLEAAEEEE
jgi:hypothetical protein